MKLFINHGNIRIYAYKTVYLMGSSLLRTFLVFIHPRCTALSLFIIAQT